MSFAISSQPAFRHYAKKQALSDFSQPRDLFRLYRGVPKAYMERREVPQIQRTDKQAPTPPIEPSYRSLSTENTTVHRPSVPKVSLNNRGGVPTLKFSFPNEAMMNAMLRPSKNNSSHGLADFNVEAMLDTMLDNMTEDDPMVKQLIEANPEFREIFAVCDLTFVAYFILLRIRVL